MKRLGSRHQNLDQKVYSRLKSMIVERKLMPGEKIYQDKLSRELGVSRTPLISALKMLEQENLVFAIPRRGFFVHIFSTEEMIAIFEVREVLEGLAARKAAQNIRNSQEKKLKTFFTEVRISNNPEDIRSYAKEDRRFHNFLIEVSGIDILPSILTTFNILTFSYQRDVLEGLVRLPKDTIDEHRAIIDAITMKDPEKAEELMRLHLRTSRVQLIKEIEGEKIKAENQ